MTTTFREIRAAFRTAIESIVPARFAGERFRYFMWEEDLDTVVRDERHGPTLFRAYRIRDNHDDSPTGYTDMHTVRVEHTFSLDLVYPKLLAKSRGEDDRMGELDDLIREDFHQINRAIGITGAENWPEGLHQSDHVGGVLIDAGPAFLHRVIYRVTYDKEQNP